MNFALAKAAVAVAMVPLALDGARGRAQQALRKVRPAALVAAFGVSRLCTAAAAFGLVGLAAPGDVATYYAQFGKAVLSGGRDPASPYSPGFDYLLGGLIWLFGTPLTIVYALTCCEIAAFAMALAALRRYNSRFALPIAWLWLVSPISVFNIALGGQDEALILAVWCAVLWAMSADRAGRAGIVVAGGVLCSKVLGTFAGLPLAAAPAGRVGRAAAAAAAVVAVAFGIAAYAHAPMLGFLQESSRVTSGNIWTWSALALGSVQPTAQGWQFVVAAATIAAALVQTRRHPLPRPEEQALRVTGTIGCLFLLLTPKSFTSYLVMFLPGVLFLVLAARRSARRVLLAVFLPVATFEASLWFQATTRGVLQPLWWARPAMLVADGILIAGYATLAWSGLRLTARSTDLAAGVLTEHIAGPVAAT